QGVSSFAILGGSRSIHLSYERIWPAASAGVQYIIAVSRQKINAAPFSAGILMVYAYILLLIKHEIC
ncbi:MAG: hypothetical protein IJC61_06415, partial [Oscillospiraceae bacterium]|nr:hypothetical protein [Oscillospiraceae bacterium]